MKIKKRTTYEIEHNDMTLELTHQPCEWAADPIITDLPGGRIVVGYLVHDERQSNPLEDCDGMGAIEKFNERDFGLSYGSPELDDLVERFLEKDDAEITGEDDCDDESAARAAVMPEWYEIWNKTDYVALRYTDGRSDEPYTIAAVNAEDIEEMFSNGGRGCDFQWRPDKHLTEELSKFSTWTERRKKALEFCQQALDEYNKYCSGDCYGVVVESFEKDGTQIEEDSCWGFLGREYAEEEAESHVESRVSAMTVNINTEAMAQ